jgi:hypothetical protein
MPAYFRFGVGPLRFSQRIGGGRRRRRGNEGQGCALAVFYLLAAAVWLAWFALILLPMAVLAIFPRTRPPARWCARSLDWSKSGHAAREESRRDRSPDGVAWRQDLLVTGAVRGDAAGYLAQILGPQRGRLTRQEQEWLAGPEAQARIAEKAAEEERAADLRRRTYTGWVEEYKRHPDGSITLLIRADGREDVRVELAPGEKVRWDDGRPFSVRTGSWLRVVLDPSGGAPRVYHETSN